MSNNEDLPATPKRGRPRGFDIDKVAVGALDLFWANGFESTSLGDIHDRLGLQASTIYNSFGGKRGLYEFAIERYLASADETLLAVARDGSGGLVDLTSLIRRLTDWLADDGSPAGCPVVNAMINGEHGEAVDEYKKLLRSAIDAAVERATRLGEIDADAGPSLASATFLTVIGLNAIAKSGATAAELRESADHFAQVIERYRMSGT